MYPGATLPARQRERARTLPLDFPRPGRSTLTSLLAPFDLATTSGALHAAGNLLTNPDGGGPSSKAQGFAVRLYVHFLAVEDELTSLLGFSPELGVVAVTWACKRLRTAEAPSVIQYLLRLRAVIVANRGVDIWHLPPVAKFRKVLGTLRGRHRQKLQKALLPDQYLVLTRSPLVPLQHKQVIILTWRRIARVADTLETRQGGLWLLESLPDGARELMLEVPWQKTKAAGSFHRLVIHLSPSEVALVRPLISSGPPTSPPQQRPLLFPSVTTATVAASVSRVFEGHAAHTLRRGAFRSALNAGIPLSLCLLLPLHGSEEGAMPYALNPDHETIGRMALVSRSTSASPVPLPI